MKQGNKMRKILLTGVAVLFLATGAAHATAIVGFKCPGLEVSFDADKSKTPYTTTLSITTSYDDPRSVFRFKMVRPKEGGTELYMNGKRCKTVLLDGREF